MNDAPCQDNFSLVDSYFPPPQHAWNEDDDRCIHPAHMMLGLAINPITDWEVYSPFFCLVYSLPIIIAPQEIQYSYTVNMILQ